MSAQRLLPTLVIGGGAWGTALAIALARNEHQTWLWTRDAEMAEVMQKQRCNTRYLPGVTLPSALEIKTDLQAAVQQAAHILIAVPSKAFAGVLDSLQPWLSDNEKPVSWATKGLLPESGAFLQQAVQSKLGSTRPLAIISGPSFAAEVAAGLPTALTVASSNVAFASDLATLLHGPQLRAYYSPDVIGVQIGGAVKNVLAIAAGISDGLQYGANARAALLTRGMAETLRLATALGADVQTMFGLAGMGDLILTCTDDQSRNRQLGLHIGQGASVAEAVHKVGRTVEGMDAAREVQMLAQQLNIEMPIVDQVCKVLFAGYDPRQSVQALLRRELKAEDSQNTV
ncbi:Glycerol-3-phosphate dehydrogenase (NAD(P)+) [Methylophaga frappieri]|uniref:Glycerol-3-phosphate dehydrogenase [NAD(P)+] n=1 Tax=Methylophaga frappieri (strain ATCC BAA-2434 / DSM 25690 / JAM7) TaxID=754477 RepID=I1YJQ9_METFJ|nr:NAD(P)H-dependent glycerol-3-phosphate dehydrogenase [Methylophaga frappieri]AFJ03152.1 Glycerol-3-phosphate dehydrogenase (NAD(P)+) [Methylophaga frappieri]